MIYAIIVTFNPNNDKLNSLISSLGERNVIPVVVDNGSKSLTSPLCKTIALGYNYGIAKAQNVGIEYALENNASAVVFFDQDSSIHDSDFIDKLYNPIVNGRSEITAPIFIDDARGFTYPIVEILKNGNRVKHYPSTNDPEFRVNNVISSGTMVDIKALRKIGNMREELFIDYVDTEWCLRAFDKGIDVLVVPAAKMVHSIGDKTIKVGRFYIPKHSPFRRYYRIRNSFYLLRQPYIPKCMAIREVVFSIAHQFILIIFSKGERCAYFRSLSKGLKDGMLGRFK